MSDPCIANIVKRVTRNLIPPATSTTCSHSDVLLNKLDITFLFSCGRGEKQKPNPRTTLLPRTSAKEKVEPQRTFYSLLSLWQLIHWSLIVIIHQVWAWRGILITATCVSMGETRYWACCKVSSKFISIGSCNGSLVMGYFWIWCNERR